MLDMLLVSVQTPSSILDTQWI